MTKLWKWSGAGNLFVILDARGGGQAAAVCSATAAAQGQRKKLRKQLCLPADSIEPSEIVDLCKEYGTDGLMVLKESAAGRDFAMEFYNPDGTTGMMCGNGGRCIAAFADMLGIKPAGKIPGQAGNDVFVFDAPDGVHTAEILGRKDGEWTVRLGMKNVEGIIEYPNGLFLNTGTRHFVTFVPDVEAIDIEAEALPIRHDARFAPEGTNVNFVELGETIKIRTFEKGVEGETAACGTGITAAAIACRYSGIAPSAEAPDGRITYRIQAREASLSVDFLQKKKDAFSDVFLTGPARILAE